jgi:hypothetical protein
MRFAVVKRGLDPLLIWPWGFRNLGAMRLRHPTGRVIAVTLAPDCAARVANWCGSLFDGAMVSTKKILNVIFAEVFPRDQPGGYGVGDRGEQPLAK